MKRTIAIILATASAPMALAQDLRAVPDYFAEAVFASTMANSLAEYCPSVSVNADAVAIRREELIVRLVSDGFDGENALSQMQDPTGLVHKIQSEFLEKYALEEATEAQVCTAALSEMGNETLLGSLLREVQS